MGEFSTKQHSDVGKKCKEVELSAHFDEDMIVIEKFNSKKPISAIYFDGKKQCYFVKRFRLDKKSKRLNFISDAKGSILEIISTDWRPQAELVFVKEKGKERKKAVISLEEFIAVKGINAIGNKLSNKKIKEINLLDSLPFESEKEIIESKNTIDETEEDGNTQISLDL